MEIVRPVRGLGPYPETKRRPINSPELFARRSQGDAPRRGNKKTLENARDRGRSGVGCYKYAFCLLMMLVFHAVSFSRLIPSQKPP